MFGKQQMLKQLSGGIVLAAFVAVLGVPSAFAGSTFITDTLGGNGKPKAIASATQAQNAVDRYLGLHGVQAHATQAYVNGGMSAAVATSNDRAAKASPDAVDRYLGIGSPEPAAQATQPYVNGGMSAAVATSNDPVVSSAGSTSSGGPSWVDAGIGAGIAAVLGLLLGAGLRLRTRRGVAVA